MQTSASENETDLVMGELMMNYAKDPVFFVEHALGHMTWSKQRGWHAAW